MTVPGSPHAMLLAQSGDPLDELRKINRSVRTRAAAGGYFSRTPAVPGNRTKFVFGGWFQGIDLVNGTYLLSVGIDGYNYDKIGVAASGQFSAVGFNGPNPGTQQWVMTTNRLFRDPLAFYHFHFIYDSTQAVASDRLKLQVNGVTETSFASIAYPSLNFATYINSGNLHRIMSMYANVFSPAYSDGLICDPYFVDGSAPDCGVFGIFHPVTSQWRPKPYNPAYGAQGWHLDFSDVSAATAAALGADRSGNGNNWMPNNISLIAGATYDSMLATPTNNYSVLNPLDVSGGATFANANLTNTTATGNGGARTTLPFPSGAKLYAEFLPAGNTNAGAGAAYGISTAAAVLSAYNSVGIYSWYSSASGNIMISGTAGASVGPMVSTDVFQCAVDTINGKVWLGKNNVWYDSAGGTTGNPATGANPTFTVTATGMYFYTMGGGIGMTYNGGQIPFAYTPPSGYGVQNTKLLPRPAITRPASAFVARTDTGTNIAATLAAAAPWSDWLRIYKRRDAAEGWRWQFADDAANYLDSSSTAAKAAFPALSGSYVAYALRVAASNGVATGRLVHTNGAADVVADGLSKARKLIILKNEATGSWYVYHPDLTAGKLLYLEQTAAETTDATISAVGTSGFTVAAALASGTYRWIAIAEIGAFIKLGKYTGNGSTDGAFAAAELSSLMALVKNTTISNWVLHDAARNGSNPTTAALYPNLTLADTAGNSTLDLLSNGFKVRAIDGSVNTNAVAYVYLSLAEFPFRYANAR